MTSSLLAVDHLVKTFARSRSPAVDDVSFGVSDGEVLGLVGESGSGKSTTARCVVGLIRPDSGRVVVAGQEVSSLKGRALRAARAGVQIVFQDPFSSLNPRMTVEELVGEGLVVHHIESNRARRRVRVVELLELVGLQAEHLSRYPRSFSGGERQRIAIARALAPSPRLLVCDEPVSSLDVSVQAQVLKVFLHLQKSLGLAMLFISHDLAVVRNLCDRVAVMEGGRIVEVGECETIYEHAQHPYTRALLAAVPIPDPLREQERRARESRLHAGGLTRGPFEH